MTLQTGLLASLSEVVMAKDQRKSGIRFPGPGTAAMLICMVLVLGWQWLQPNKVRIEHKVEASGETAIRLPTLSELLEWKAVVCLTEEQISKITQLDHEQVIELSPVDAQIADVRAQVDGSTKNGSRAGMTALNSLASQIAGPSRRKREIERRFSEQAWLCLSNDQKEKALGLWRVRWSSTTRKVTEK